MVYTLPMNTQLAETPAAPPIEWVRLNKLERPKTTFFYQRLTDDEDVEEFPEVDGEGQEQRTGPRIEAFSEKEAAMLPKGQWRQLGVSDGVAYYKAIQAAIAKHGQPMPIAVAQEAIRQAFAAELAVAKANKKARGIVKPFVSHKHIGSVSADVKDGMESLVQSGYRPQMNTKE